MKTFNDLYVETATTATFTIGFSGVAGKLLVNSPYTDSQGTVISYGFFSYDGATALLAIGDKLLNKHGKIILGRSSTTTQAIVLDGATNSITVGDKNSGAGMAYIRNSSGNNTITIDGAQAKITLGTAATTTGFFTEDANDGELFIKNKSGVETIKLEGRAASLTMGATAAAGDLHIKNASDVETVYVNGGTGTITLGATGVDGEIIMKNSLGNNAIVLDADGGLLTLGGVGTTGDITIKNSNDIDTIKIIGASGDIEFLNADFAEEFDIAETELGTAIPGTVMCLGADGELSPSTKAYDSRVAGIIAGAGSFKPGIVMDKKGGDNRRAVAMVGKVYCYADAANGAIEAGDMLTTSHRKGYAMKATDREKAFGATIGKALGSLPSGTGLIPVLVTLQ